MSGSEYVLTLFVLLAYKSLIIVAGLVIIYLGYCFLNTAYEKSNNNETTPKPKKFIVTGAIFAFFGAGILICSMLQGIDIEKAHKVTSGQNKLLNETEPISGKVIEQKKDCNK